MDNLAGCPASPLKDSRKSSKARGDTSNLLGDAAECKQPKPKSNDEEAQWGRRKGRRQHSGGPSRKTVRSSR